MIRDKEGQWFTLSEIIGNERQITATISSREWKHFPINSKVKAVSLKGETFYRRVRSLGNGKQRNISIPKDEWGSFSKGQKIKIYPEEQPKKDSDSMNEQDKNKQNEQVLPKTDMSQMQ